MRPFPVLGCTSAVKGARQPSIRPCRGSVLLSVVRALRYPTLCQPTSDRNAKLPLRWNILCTIAFTIRGRGRSQREDTSVAKRKTGACLVFPGIFSVSSAPIQLHRPLECNTTFTYTSTFYLEQFKREVQPMERMRRV